MDRVIAFQEFETKTGGRLDALDITEKVLEVARASGVTQGNVLVFSPHTTCSVLIGHAGNGTVELLERTMHALAPEDGYYQHDDLSVRTENMMEGEPANAPAHIFHVFAGKASECIPIVGGCVALGAVQRVLFVELDSPRARRYCVQVVGE
jgi:secondary thiamine-phosphate synthase enzyme